MSLASHASPANWQLGFEHWFLTPIIIELFCVCTSDYIKRAKSLKKESGKKKKVTFSRTDHKGYSPISFYSLMVSYCQKFYTEYIVNIQNIMISKKLTFVSSSLSQELQMQRLLFRSNRVQHAKVVMNRLQAACLSLNPDSATCWLWSLKEVT